MDALLSLLVTHCTRNPWLYQQPRVWEKVSFCWAQRCINQALYGLDAAQNVW